MKQPSLVSRFSRVALLILLIATAATGFGQTPKAPEPDPILGRWRWSNAQIVIFYPDGKAHCDSYEGTWKVLSTATPRKYEINWAERFVDTVRLIKNATQLDGSTKGGGKISAERLPAK